MQPRDYDWLDEQTRAAPNHARLIDAIEAVSAKLHLKERNSVEPTNLDDVLAVLSALKAEIESNSAIDQTLKDRADGVFAEGVHRLVRSSVVTRETANNTLGVLASWIEDSAKSLNPEVDKNTEASFERFASWGSPSARLEAAEAALDICIRAESDHPVSCS